MLTSLFIMAFIKKIKFFFRKQTWGSIKEVGSKEVHIPITYTHHDCLEYFNERHANKFGRYLGNLEDKYFKDSIPLISGSRYTIRAFEALKSVSLGQAHRILWAHDAILAGPQGLIISWGRVPEFFAIDKRVFCLSPHWRTNEHFIPAMIQHDAVRTWGVLGPKFQSQWEILFLSPHEKCRKGDIFLCFQKA